MAPVPQFGSRPAPSRPPAACRGTPDAPQTDAGQSGTALAELVDLVFGDEDQQALLALRLDAFLDQLGSGPVTSAQERVRGLVTQRVEGLVRDSFRDLGRWQTQLRAIANQLEDLETRARVEPDRT